MKRKIEAKSMIQIIIITKTKKIKNCADSLKLFVLNVDVDNRLSSLRNKNPYPTFAIEIRLSVVEDLKTRRVECDVNG